MLYKLPLIIRWMILIAVYIVVFYLAFHFYDLILRSNLIGKLIYTFTLLWDLVLVGFTFFQLFKYWRLPFTSYYEPKSFENTKWFSKLLVPVFQKALINSPFRYLNQRVYLKGKGRKYIKQFIEETKQSETSHIFSGIVTIGFQISLLLEGDVFGSVFLGVFNVVFNLYPFLLQRMNRSYIMSRFDINRLNPQ